MKAPNACLTLAVVVVGALIGSDAQANNLGGTQAPVKIDAEMSMPTTPDQHLARAGAYQAKATEYRQEAALHRKMFADYDRQQGNPALQTKTGRELPWVAKMRRHCEGYIKDAERLAADAEQFALFHRMLAEEARGK